MAIKRKFACVEEDGINLPDYKERLVRASDTTFDNSTNGYDATDSQAAIEESLGTAISTIVIPITLVYNGTLSNGDWITYSNLTPDTRVAAPIDSTFLGFTWSNSRSSLEFDLVFRKNGRTQTPFYTYQIRNSPNKFAQVTGLDYDFDAGDIIDIEYIDQGTNASDMALVIFFIARLT